MIPILDSTSVAAPNSEGLRSSGANTSQGSEGKQFGSILSAQERVSEVPDTADAPPLDGSDALQPGGNELPSGGKSLPASPLSPELELAAETTIALRAVSVGSDSTPTQSLDPLAALLEEASDSEISTATPGAVAPVQALELEAAPATIAAKGELPAQPILQPDALLRHINSTSAAGSNRPGQTQLNAASATLTNAPSADALAGDSGLYQKAALADAAFSVVTPNPDSAVDMADTLKGIDLLALKASPGNTLSAAQTIAAAQPAIAEAVNTATGALRSGVAAPLHTPVGDPGWNGEFASRIGVMVKNGVPEASLQLSPAELGRLDIKISTDGDQAKVVFTVQNMAAREAIEQAMPRLREMLEQSGLQLAHSEVADQSQSRQQGDDMLNTFTGESIAESEELSPDMSSMPLIAASDAMVDYYV